MGRVARSTHVSFPRGGPLRRALRAAAWLATLAPGLLASSGAAGLDPPRVIDLFDRDLGDHGIVLVDWEGHLANPAQRFFLEPPPGAVFPATATLSANGARLYFNDPGGTNQVGADGPTKTLTFEDAAPRGFRFAVFPDRAGGDEQYALTVSFEDATGSTSTAVLPVHVIDQDVGTPPEFVVQIDVSEDQSGFFGPAQQALLQQAADDWAYFIADMQLDAVPAGAETKWIWNWPLAWTGSGGHYTTNASGYSGFLLYAYGIDTPELRSGGEPANCCFHSSGGAMVDLRRSGGVEIEVKGNYNTKGWLQSTDEDTWWVSGNLSDEPNDLYSIAHHEFGHAFAFHGAYPRFWEAAGAGQFDDPAILAYHGGPVAVNSTYSHFSGVVDRQSKRGIFGNEYKGGSPARRWLITKLDLLLLKAVGYELRPTSAFEPLAIADTSLAQASPGLPYDDGLSASGGVPFYDWTVRSGTLPAGLALDPFSGRIEGTPLLDASHAFSIEVRDYDEAGSGLVLDTHLDVGQVWSHLGQGLAGAHGRPQLSGQGSLAGGEAIELAVFGALENAPAALVLGFSRIDAPLKGGVLVPFPDVVLDGLATDASGDLSVSSTWPAGLPAGLTSYFQWWIADPAGPAGYAASNAVSATTP